jgi:hypothetical protein
MKFHRNCKILKKIVEFLIELWNFDENRKILKIVLKKIVKFEGKFPKDRYFLFCSQDRTENVEISLPQDRTKISKSCADACWDLIKPATYTSLRKELWKMGF